MSKSSPLWVFAYGSLMWRPGFLFEEQAQACVIGYRRALCVKSFVHRGTPERPGLVLGLDRGGACRGLAFRVAEERAEEVLAYLREREQVLNVYHERWLTVRLQEGRCVQALAFVVNRAHPQYAGGLSLEEMLAFIRQGVGQAGSAIDYVLSTHAHLEALGVHDPVLARLSAALHSLYPAKEVAPEV